MTVVTTSTKLPCGGAAAVITMVETQEDSPCRSLVLSRVKVTIPLAKRLHSRVDVTIPLAKIEHQL